MSFLQQQDRDHNNQDEASVPGRDGTLISGIICYNCSRDGHYANNCPEEQGEQQHRSRGRGRRGVISTQLAVSFAQTTDNNNLIPDSWILLDTCSTDSIFKNKHLVSNIRPCSEDDILTMVSNGGVTTYDEIADLNILPIRVHFDENSIANVLSLKDVAAIPGATLTMNTKVDKAISLHLKSGATLSFMPCKEGLYYYDVNDGNNNNNKTKLNNKSTSYSVSFLNTVDVNKQNFTKNELRCVEKVREIQQIMGWPSSKALKDHIKNNSIRNCEITLEDVEIGRAHV